MCEVAGKPKVQFRSLEELTRSFEEREKIRMRCYDRATLLQGMLCCKSSEQRADLDQVRIFTAPHEDVERRRAKPAREDDSLKASDGAVGSATFAAEGAGVVVAVGLRAEAPAFAPTGAGAGASELPRGSAQLRVEAPSFEPGSASGSKGLRADAPCFEPPKSAEFDSASTDGGVADELSSEDCSSSAGSCLATPRRSKCAQGSAKA
eukprot:TRINITY_DN17249_c0_g1_i1.p2 TRINITY_DN17249_c0_g1~~TRINITY_DN17249_c0_g1_i1.p2  ORF type:complete len:207 (+),score=60.14 TRINITY_DN17249_c0_g1_i1:89-709(+)